MKPGYKQTEVGVIPEDWETPVIGDLQPFVTSGSRGWAEYYSEYGSPFIRITNLTRESIYLDLEDLRFVTLPENNSEGARTQLRADDLLISITADIGIVGIVSPDLPSPAYINQHIALVRLNPVHACSKYITYFLASERPQSLFRALTDSGAKAGMNLTTVQQICIATPPTLAEQRAIAGALSDADALIDSLEQLIAKKRLLKQGAMQDLLTGKKRLPGFEGEWEVVCLGNVSNFFKGKGLPKSAISSSGVDLCIHYGELFTQYPHTIKDVISQTNATTDSFRSCANDVLMPTSDVTPRGLAKASCVTMDGVVLGGDILVIRTHEGRVNGTFLSCLIRLEEQQILQLVTGSTVYHLYASDMKKFSLRLPSLPEQTAIAAILSDMDMEIAALEAKLSKARQLKQGMMQELLTGKTRLPGNAEPQLG